MIFALQNNGLKGRLSLLLENENILQRGERVKEFNLFSLSKEKVFILVILFGFYELNYQKDIFAQSKRNCCDNGLCEATDCSRSLLLLVLIAQLNIY